MDIYGRMDWLALFSGIIKIAAIIIITERIRKNKKNHNWAYNDKKAGHVHILTDELYVPCSLLNYPDFFVECKAHIHDPGAH